MTLYFFAFLSGLVTIFAPCIWPLLPIILSSGVTGGHRKPLGIVTGISVSFLFATLALTFVLRIFPIDPEIFRLLGIGIIVLLGIMLLIPKATLWLEGGVSRLVGRFGIVQNTGTGFGAGFITGAALGLVWSPCAGPILATVATVAATQGVSVDIFLIALFFVLGVSVPLFSIAFLGQKAFVRMRGANTYTARIQQVFGVVIIATGLLIYTGYDKVFQSKFLEMCGSAGTWLTSFESSDFISAQLEELRLPGGAGTALRGDEKIDPNHLAHLGPAPEFSGITTWLNTDSGRALTMSEDLKGKVVLIDFWTYSCINCIRTLPYVREWHEKYKDAGFTVIGVHTPEFLFEQKTENVAAAIKQYQLTYPVAQDNQYATWQSYRNRYWPAHYLIDAKGNIRYTHFGEGKYQETEAAIQALLQEAGQASEEGFVQVEAEAEGTGEQTRETYLGVDRMERFQSAPAPELGTQVFVLSQALPVHSWGYKGTWNLEAERGIAENGAALQFQVKAKKVFLVMGPTQQSAPVEVWLDGQPIPEAFVGSDVVDGKITVAEERLYELVNAKEGGEHSLELIFPEGGVAVYAFTFS